MSDRFDRFTERARHVLQLAQHEAERLNHDYLAGEHLLLGILREGQGVAVAVLANLGIEPDAVRAAIEARVRRAEGRTAGAIGLTPSAKKSLELAVDEARRLNHRYIGTEHLLLGLIREDHGVAADVLKSLGASLDKLRSQAVYVLNSSGTPNRPRAARPGGSGPAAYRSLDYR